MPGRGEKPEPARFDKEIFSMSKGELRELFSFKNGELHTSGLIRHLIWDDLHRLRAGELEKFDSNIRSYWYGRVKPVLARARARRFADKYDAMIGEFTSLVLREGRMSYRDFGFVDQKRPFRKVGRENGEVWVVAEKLGHWPLLEDLERDYGVTVIALGGSPSVLASETFIGQLRRSGVEPERVMMLTMVDYDPSGHNIAASFISHMKTLGYRSELKRVDLVAPSRMSDEQVRLNKFPLPRSKRERSKNRKWVAKTGSRKGWGYTAHYGLGVEAMTRGQLISAFEEEAGPHMTADPERIRRRRLRRELSDVLATILIDRLTS